MKDDFKIVWSSFAESQIDEIFEYYKYIAGIEIAKNLIQGIVNAPNKLIKTPFIGQNEPRLKHRLVHYKYLIYKNYKLIYSVDEENGYIKVADVFDTRQNPIKIGRGKI